MNRVGLNNDELKQLAADLAAGRPWEELEQELQTKLAPGVLEASDYKAWAHRQAGLELGAPPAPPQAEEPELEPEEAEPALVADDQEQKSRKRRRK